MSVKVSHLREVSIDNVDHVRQSFVDTGTAYAKAAGTFDPEVWNKLSAGHVWTGTGSSEARSVAETNSVAFAAAEVVADTAQLALSGFHTATARAQRRLNDALDEGFKAGIDVHEDGTAYVVKDTQTYHEPEHLSGAGPTRPTGSDLEDIRDRVERKVKGCLVFATVADRSCAAMLDGLRGLMPGTTAYYDPSALDHNRHVLAGALSAQSLAHVTSEFWREAKPKTLPEDDTGKRMQSLALDAIEIQVTSGGIAASTLLDGTVIGAILGVPLGYASEKGLESAVKDAWKNVFSEKKKLPRTDPPNRADKILAEAYEHGKVSPETLEDHKGGESFTPRADDTDGEQPRPGEPPAGHPYERYTVDTGSGRKEWVIVDTENGKVYYCDQFQDGEPVSFEKVG